MGFLGSWEGAGPEVPGTHLWEDRGAVPWDTDMGVPGPGCQEALGDRAQSRKATDTGTQGTVPSTTDMKVSRNQGGRACSPKNTVINSLEPRYLGL